MWHKAEWMGRPMRLELTRVGLLVKLANRYTNRGARHWSDISSDDTTDLLSAHAVFYSCSWQINR